MASNIPDFNYCCEICGLDDLSEDEFRIHTHTAHVDGCGVCPFCELTIVNPAELILHVNQAHLDFLTPDSEQNMSFIDDPSPSDFNGFNGESSTNWNNPATYSNKDVYAEKMDSKSSFSNINLTPKVNGGGAVSPEISSHGQGSPLRCNLALKLKSPVPELQCPMCNYTSNSPDELEEHVNRRHFDLISPSVGMSTTTETFSCPLCVKTFSSAPDLELHVNIEHKDVLSPASPAVYACPVCGVALDRDHDSEAVQQHVESHFPAGSPQPSDRAALREREKREFELLRAQYGMDNQGNFREQSVTNMQRAVYAGEMSVADYYERQLDLKAAESCGVDDGSSITRSIVPRVKAMSANASNVVRTLLCTCVDHYASSYGDRGWGCGYRNTQMLISSLLTHTGYNERLYKLWQKDKPPRSSVPSISRLQSLIEQAWSQGFDIQGSEQLGCRLVNTRKWIGATEVVTLLSFLRIRCQLVDFHRPTGPGGSHPELFSWVLNYFESSVGGEFTPPLYLQHQGHSRTIMGIEVHRDGSLVLLVLDPSHSPQQMAQLGDTNGTSGALRLLRKSEAAMKARQYQVVAVVGTIDNEQQYQSSKILRGTRIPPERAAKDGVLEILKEATSRDCNGRDEQGMTPTLYAAFHGNLEALRLLCGRGGDPDKADLFGNTALHLASAQGHMRIVTFLVNFGANIYNTDIDGRTAQELSGINNREDILRFLDGVSAKMEASDKKKVKVMKEKAKENAKKRIKNYNKHKAKTEHMHEKLERRQTKDYRPSMINTIKARIKSGSMSNLSNVPPERRNTFSNLVMGGTVKGSKTMGTVQRKILANKNNRLGTQNEDDDFKVTTIENGKASISKLSGIRRDSEVMYGGTLQRSAFDPHRRGRLDGIFNEAEQIDSAPPPPPSNGMIRSISQPDFLAELQSNDDKPLQEPSSIFIRPGMGSIVIRKSLNSFGGFYQNANRPEESSLGSGESYTQRAITDDELSDSESEEEEDSPNAPLERFLTAFGLGEYISRFIEQKIDLDTLLILTENDLKSLNLPLGPYRKLVNAISERKTALENPGEVTDSAL